MSNWISLFVFVFLAVVTSTFCFSNLPLRQKLVNRNLNSCNSRILSLKMFGGGKNRGNNGDGFGPDEGSHDDDDDEDYDEEDEKSSKDIVKPGSNVWDESVVGTPEVFDELSQPLNARVCAQLEADLEEAATDMAIKTVTFYMDEFRDDVSQQYILGFKNYRENGFSKYQNGWRGWIEDMIKTDKHEILVTITPPKSFFRSNGIPEARNVKVQYATSIEPRKFAHRIMTVRENVCNELMEDLVSIRNENNEAARIASIWTRDHVTFDEATKNRKPTRLTSAEQNSTPFRDKNFYEIDMLVTNYAIDLLRSDELHQHNPKEHEAMMEYLDRTLQLLEEEFESKDPMYKLLNKFKGPQTLLEYLYHNGLEEGHDGSADGVQSRVYKLKLAQELFKLRLMISKEAIRTLNSIVLTSRSFFKLIKDSGGFSRIDLSGRPKYQIIDLDAEREKETAAAILRENINEAISQATSNLTGNKSKLGEPASILASSSSSVSADIGSSASSSSGSSGGSAGVVGEDEFMDRDPDSFFTGGPAMM